MDEYMHKWIRDHYYRPLMATYGVGEVVIFMKRLLASAPADKKEEP